jgi:hypothetical protein
MGMAANPPGAHQAGRVFTGRIDRGGVSACYSAARWHAFDKQARPPRQQAACRQDSQIGAMEFFPFFIRSRPHLRPIITT